MTPVHDAAFKGHTKLYQALIKLSPHTGMDTGVCSVDPNIRDKLGYLSSDYLSNFQYEFPPDLPGMK